MPGLELIRAANKWVAIFSVGALLAAPADVGCSKQHPCGIFTSFRGPTALKDSEASACHVENKTDRFFAALRMTANRAFSATY